MSKSATGPLITSSHFKLPAELWLRACHHLTQSDLLSASRVNAALRAYTVNDSALWTSYSGVIAWEKETGCQCEQFGAQIHPDMPPPTRTQRSGFRFGKDISPPATNAPIRTKPWKYSFARAHAEMQLFIERSGLRPFHLSLDIWCGLSSRPALLSTLVDLIKSDSLCLRLVTFSLISSDKPTIAALLDRALRHTTHLHDVTIDLRESTSRSHQNSLQGESLTTGNTFESIAPFLSGSLTSSTLVYWWAESTTPFARLQTLHTSFVGALMFAEIPNIWPNVVEVKAYFNDDSLQDAPDPTAVVRALHQLKRLTVIVYVGAFQPLSQGLLYPGETRHMERLDVLVNDHLATQWFRSPKPEELVAEEIQSVRDELEAIILQLLGEICSNNDLRGTGLPDVQLTLERLETGDTGMGKELMHVFRARCRKTGRVRSVGLSDTPRWTRKTFVKTFTPVVWRAIGGEDGTEVVPVTELVAPAECLLDLLSGGTPHSVSRIQHIRLGVTVDSLVGEGSDVALPQLPALRTVDLTALDGRLYSFAQVEGIVRPLIFAAGDTLAEVRLGLERTKWTPDELRLANDFAPHVVGLP